MEKKKNDFESRTIYLWRKNRYDTNREKTCAAGVVETNFSKRTLLILFSIVFDIFKTRKNFWNRKEHNLPLIFEIGT